MTGQVITERRDGVLSVRMNRPEKKNALTAAMYSELADALQCAADDPSVRVVLFSGAEGAFTAGNDLVDFLENPPAGEGAPVFRFISGLVDAEVPLVAAVDGLAVGIGTTLLLHCDFVLATERSKFSLPFVNLALVPEAGSSLLLVETCGYRKAAEWLLLGEPFTAAEAAAHGVVTRICAEERLMADAEALAARLAAKPGGAMRATKRLLRRPPEPLEQRVEAEGAVFTHCLGTPAAREAFAAFLEKRKPDFTGLD